MAEKVVLADIVFSEEGAVASLKRTDAAIVGTSDSVDILARHTRATSDIFIGRMFSMRQAAVAFLGGFTLAGVINGMKNLIVEAAEGDAHFKELAASGKVFHQALLAIIRDLPGFSAGIEDLSDAVLKLTAAMRTAASKEGFLAFLDAMNAGLLVLQGPTGWVGALGHMAIGLHDAGDAADEFSKILARLRAERDALLAGPKAPPSFKLTPFEFPKFGARGAEDFPFEVLSQQLSRFSPFADQAAASTERLHQAMLGIKTLSVGDEFAQGFKRASIEVTSFHEHLDLTADALQIVSVGLQAASAGIAQMIIEGGSGKDLFAGVMKSLSYAMFAKAAEYTAYGIAASTGIGTLTLQGTPAQFFTAAAEFAGAGAAAGLLARGAGGSDRRGSGSHSVAAAAPPQRQSQNITYVIEGSVVGVGMSKEQFAAEQAELIKKALSDGAAGGSLSSGWTNG